MIKLILGDCLEKMRDIESGSVDMCLTDPPFGTTACKWDSIIPLEPMWEQLKRIIKPNGAIVLHGCQPFTSALIMSNPKMFKYEWVYNKTRPSGMQVAKYKPMVEHENILIFGINKANYFPIMVDRPENKKRFSSAVSKSESSPLQKIDGKKRYYDKFYPRSILKFSNGYQQKRLHPTEKPVPLLEYLIRTYTSEGETVLDFTMGSGSTGCAAKALNRDFIGIELDQDYFDIAEKRIAEY